MKMSVQLDFGGTFEATATDLQSDWVIKDLGPDGTYLKGARYLLPDATQTLLWTMYGLADEFVNPSSTYARGFKSP